MGRFAIATVTLLVSSSGWAMKGECTWARRARLDLYAHGHNIAMADVTRTPEGTPPARLIASCEKATGHCNVAVDPLNNLRLMYDPSHPDANSDGYVQYPNTDSANERAAFNIALTELRAAGHKRLCSISIQDLGSAAVMYFGDSVGGGSEVVNFGDDGKVVSWSQRFADGTGTLINFDRSGKVVSLDESDNAGKHVILNLSKKIRHLP